MQKFLLLLLFVSANVFAEQENCESTDHKGDSNQIVKVTYDPIKSKETRSYVVYIDLPRTLNGLAQSGGAVTVGSPEDFEMFTHLEIYPLNGQLQTWFRIKESNVAKTNLIFWYGPCNMRVNVKLDKQQALKAWSSIHDSEQSNH